MWCVPLYFLKFLYTIAIEFLTCGYGGSALPPRRDVVQHGEGTTVRSVGLKIKQRVKHIVSDTQTPKKTTASDHIIHAHAGHAMCEDKAHPTLYV